MRQIRTRDWFIPIILLALIAIVLWLSPDERTLGSRIKIVYIHVAFVWTGLTGLLLTGLLSPAVFLQPLAKRLEKLLPIMSLTSVICFAIGFILSLAAAKINWGGILWTEPRVIAATRILSVAVIVQVLAFWFVNLRFRAVLYILLLAFTVITQATVQNAVHPVNPIFSSDSNSFAIAVLTLVALVSLLALWFMNISYRQLTTQKQH